MAEKIDVCFFEKKIFLLEKNLIFAFTLLPRFDFSY